MIINSIGFIVLTYEGIAKCSIKSTHFNICIQMSALFKKILSFKRQKILKKIHTAERKLQLVQ